MKIIMVTNNTLEDKMGGHERYVRELAATLSGRGNDVTVLAKRWSADSAAREVCSDGVVLERYDVPSKSNPLYAGLYAGYVLRGVATRTGRRAIETVIHAHMGLPALPLAARRQPYLLTFHAPVWRELLSERQGTYALPRAIQTPAVRGLRLAERLVARRATRTIVLSEFMRSELAILDGRAAARAALIPGGVDPGKFSPDRAVQLAPNARPPVLFTARRLTPRTGVDELLKAMPTIRAAFPGAELKVAGVGPQRDELRGLAAGLGLNGAIEFLGRISDDSLVDWYRRASLVVLPSRELEGFGLTTAEALACGAAVVGTPAGATPELLAGVDRGLITRDISAEAIATAVTGLLRDPARLADIRCRASDRVMPGMGWERVADQHLDIYHSLT